MVLEKCRLNFREIKEGKKIAVANALNLLDDHRPENFEAVKELIQCLSRNPRRKRHVIGITGPPGVGKSTIISRIIHLYRSQKQKVGIISVDPSNKTTGGALLGDRARISCDPTDEGIFIRSMAAGAHLGGLAWKTRNCLTVFESVYDVIILETVGVGQSETEIDHVVDTVIFVIQPGSGDVLQFIKAGIMDIPHIFVVNKADQRTLAAKTQSDLKTVSGFHRHREGGWKLELIMASSLEGWGHEELVAVIERHRRFLLQNSLLEKRRQNRIQWIYDIFEERFGSFGIEVLGGKKRMFRLIEHFDLTNPFDSVRRLTEKLWKAAGISNSLLSKSNEL